MLRILALLALTALTQISGATLIDMGEYILSTGEYRAYNPQTINLSNETSGEYAFWAFFGKDASYTFAILMEGSKFNESNLTAAYVAVAKPYPGYIREDLANGTVVYTSEVKDGLQLSIVFYSQQAAIDILPHIAVIPREEYDAAKSEELLAALS